MNLRGPRREEPDVNLTPLIDVVFLLLIFFMVSTTFTREAELTIDLPEASAKAAPRKEEMLEITINAQGEYFVNQQRVVNTDAQTLKRALRQAVGERKEPPLVISADGKAPHQSVITAMDAARQLGIVHLTFATKQTDGSD